MISPYGLLEVGENQGFIDRANVLIAHLPRGNQSLLFRLLKLCREILNNSEV